MLPRGNLKQNIGYQESGAQGFLPVVVSEGRRLIRVFGRLRLDHRTLLFNGGRIVTQHWEIIGE